MLDSIIGGAQTTRSASIPASFTDSGGGKLGNDQLSNFIPYGDDINPLGVRTPSNKKYNSGLFNDWLIYIEL